MLSRLPRQFKALVREGCFSSFGNLRRDREGGRFTFPSGDNSRRRRKDGGFAFLPGYFKAQAEGWRICFFSRGNLRDGREGGDSFSRSCFSVPLWFQDQFVTAGLLPRHSRNSGHKLAADVRDCSVSFFSACRRLIPCVHADNRAEIRPARGCGRQSPRRAGRGRGEASPEIRQSSQPRWRLRSG